MAEELDVELERRTFFLECYEPDSSLSHTECESFLVTLLDAIGRVSNYGRKEEYEKRLRVCSSRLVHSVSLILLQELVDIIRPYANSSLELFERCEQDLLKTFPSMDGSASNHINVARDVGGPSTDQTVITVPPAGDLSAGGDFVATPVLGSNGASQYKSKATNAPHTDHFVEVDNDLDGGSVLTPLPSPRLTPCDDDPGHPGQLHGFPNSGKESPDGRAADKPGLKSKVCTCAFDRNLIRVDSIIYRSSFSPLVSYFFAHSLLCLSFDCSTRLFPLF